MVKQILETSKIRSVAKLCSGGDLCLCKKLFSNLQDTFQNVENATLSWNWSGKRICVTLSRLIPSFCPLSFCLFAFLSFNFLSWKWPGKRICVTLPHLIPAHRLHWCSQKGPELEHNSWKLSPTLLCQPNRITFSIYKVFNNKVFNNIWINLKHPCW